jgi:hypothetical protein
LVLLSLLLVLVIGISSDAYNQDLPYLLGQEDIDEFGFVTLDNVTIEEGLLSTCLVVGYSWNGGSEAAMEQYLLPGVMLSLSMDNSSWLRMETNSFDSYENVSRYFRVYNSLTQPFPFDVEPGETLYVRVLFGYGMELNWRPDFNHQTPSVGIVIHSGIIRYWHFTIDWRVPGVFVFVFGWVGVVFLMSRLLKPQTGH